MRERDLSRQLSQVEIDAVFQSLRDRKRETPAAKFDFRRPDRIPKSQVRAIHLLHDTFVRNLVSSLSAYLRSYLTVVFPQHADSMHRSLVLSRQLSQTEIDAVFQNMQDRKRETPAVKFDFRRPDRIPKSQVRAIHLLHDTFVRNLVSSLSAYLRSYLTVNLVSVEQLSY